MKVVEQFKRRILDLAIRGKLVPQDPNDEPASVLLERIKAEKAKLVKAGKIKKEKNPSEIVIGSDGAAYEKFADGSTKDISDELPFALPNGWAWTRLRCLTTLVTSGSRNWAQFYTPSQQAPLFLRMGNLSRDSFSLRLGDLQHVELPKDAEGTRTSVLPGDLLFSITAEIGMMGLIPAPFPLAYINQHTALIRFSLIQQGRYLPYVLLSTFAKHQYASRKHGLKTSFRLDSIEEVIVPLPPISEQKRIVAKIEELFAIAGSLDSATDGLENAAKRLDKKILDLAIRGKLVPQDPNDEPASELVKRIAASHKSPSKNQSEPIDPPFAIPQSWEWVRLKDLGVFCSGHTPSTSNPNLWGGDMLWVSSKDMKSKYIDDTQMKVTQLGAEELNVLKPGTLLMCTRSGILRRVFPIAIARRELTINQDQRALTLWLPEMIEYVYLALKSLESIILSDYKKSGTTVESIIWNKFVDLPIPLPPLNEQKRIVKRVDEFKALTRMFATS